MMNGTGPEHEPADEKAKAVRERTMDLFAAASLHAERIGAAAAKLGLSSDLVDGLGDDLYEAAIAQLDVASKMLARSQAIAARLLEAGVDRSEPSRFVRLDVAPGERAHVRFVVRNASAERATIEVRVEWNGPEGLRPRVGREELPAGRETSVEIAIPPAAAGDPVRAGTARVWLAYDGARRVELPHHDFEIWVGEK